MLTLVTGANGHIGSRIVKRLLDRGRRVRALVRKSSNLAGLLNPAGQLPEGLELCWGDVTDRDSVGRALAGATRVFHTAAVFDTRTADLEGMVRTNHQGTLEVGEMALRQGVERFVYTSSVAAIGYTREPLVVLDEATWNGDPIDEYTASKTSAEKAIHVLVQEGLPAVIVNPATVLGPGDHKPTPSNAFVLLALQKGTPVTFNSGHTYVDVDDIALGHLLAEEKGRRGERYVLGGTQASNDVLLAELARRRGGRRPLIKLGHAAVEVLGWGVELKAKLLHQKPLFTRKKAHKLIDYYGYFSHAKAERELGYAPRPLDQVLDRAEAWYREKGWLGPQ